MSIVSTVKIPKLQRTRIKGLSHSFDFNSRIGDLIPFLALECVPGDIVKFGVESTIQFPALYRPMFSGGMNAEFFYSFIPYRILWKNFEKFLPVYQEYDENGVNTTPSLPKLEGTTGSVKSVGDDTTKDNVSAEELDYLGNSYTFNQKFSLSDYLNAFRPMSSFPSSSYRPIDLHHRAYLAFYEYFFRDENVDRHVFNFDTKKPVIFGVKASNNTEQTAGIMSIAWKKDMFTGVLPWTQKGVAPALPIYGTAQLSDTGLGLADIDDEDAVHGYMYAKNSAQPGDTLNIMNSYPNDANSKIKLVSGEVDLSRVTAADINELWTSMQIQKFLIRNATVGTKWHEFLLGQYGIAPNDETLQRPEFLGSTKQPVYVSEVVQNSESASTPQGNKAGKAVSVGADYIGKYHVKEPGVLMGVCAIRPRALYTQGVERFYYKKTPYDFYNRLFENLSDVAVSNREIYQQGTSADDGIFGYLPIYYDYKMKVDRVAGDLRDDLAVWHTGRIFSSLPNFNESFLHRGYESIDRIFQQNSNSRNCVWHVYNKIDMLRPMSYLNLIGARI